MFNFINEPQGRTADVVADLKVFLTQLYVWNLLPEETQSYYVEDPQAMGDTEILIDRAKLKLFFRAWVEEAMRRSLKGDVELNLTKVLIPNMKDINREVSVHFNKEIEK